MSHRSSRLAWLEPLDVDEHTNFSPPHWKDFIVPGSMKAYSSVAMAGLFSAALAILLGLGRPGPFAMVALAHCVVVGLVVGGASVTGWIWPSEETSSNHAIFK